MPLCRLYDEQKEDKPLTALIVKGKNWRVRGEKTM